MQIITKKYQSKYHLQVIGGFETTLFNHNNVKLKAFKIKRNESHEIHKKFLGRSIYKIYTLSPSQ